MSDILLDSLSPQVPHIKTCVEARYFGTLWTGHRTSSSTSSGKNILTSTSVSSSEAFAHLAACGMPAKGTPSTHGPALSTDNTAFLFTEGPYHSKQQTSQRVQETIGVMADAPVQSTSDLFGDNEDFGLAAGDDATETVPAENRAQSDRAESIDLYGDVAGVCRHANFLPFHATCKLLKICCCAYRESASQLLVTTQELLSPWCCCRVQLCKKSRRPARETHFSTTLQEPVEKFVGRNGECEHASCPRVTCCSVHPSRCRWRHVCSALWLYRAWECHTISTCKPLSITPCGQHEQRR